MYFLLHTNNSTLFAQVPVADFSVNSFTTCVGSPITFNDLSNYGSASVINRVWNFGEGGQSSDANPTYTYQSPGVYQVLLTVISTGGTDFEVKLDYITVYPNPTVDFSLAGNGCSVPFNVNFSNLSSIGPEFTYSWNFGNGQTSNSFSPPVITYNADGNYNAQLIVTNTTTGCITNFSKNIVVSNYEAGISAPIGGCINTPLTFTDASTVGANNWTWITSDGQTSNAQNPVFSFPTVGTYTVTLTSENTLSNCSSNTSHTIEIVDVPMPTFTSDKAGGCSPLTVNFTNTSGNTSGTFEWNFGDGTTFTGENPPPHIYHADGNYTVSLSLENYSCIGDTIVTNAIIVGLPFVDFEGDSLSGCDPLVMQFSDLSLSVDPTNPIVDWQWDFGDGTTYNGQSPPAHTYNIGQYNVTLTVTLQNGCTNTITKQNYIEVGAIDLVDFSMFPINTCAKTDVTFTNLSVISTPHDPNEVEYLWDFGDGGTDINENPIYNYPIDTGLFSIELMVTFRGCSLSASKPDQVYILAPIARFSNPNLFCNPTTLPLVINVTDDALAGESTDDVTMIWRWGVAGDPDDVLNASQIFDNDKGNVTHVYSDYGAYTIKQVVINNTTGCADSVENTLFITTVEADFNLSTDSICSGLPLDLTSTSIFSHPDASFEYQMGNGDIITDDPGQYTYNLPGIYDINLIVTNAVGCRDTSTFPNFVVLENPVADLTASDIAGCLPITVNYTNQSYTTGNGLALTSFDWTFPDGSTETTNNINTETSFTFSNEGTFRTSLVATDIFGCVSPPTFIEMLITKPIASTTMDTVMCDLENITAWNTATGYGNLTYEWYIDGVFNSNDVNIEFTFDEEASSDYDEILHTIGLTVTDENGCTDSISKNMHVSLPKADLNYVASGATANNLGEYTCPPVFETFTDSSSTYGNITRWNWSFGDGTSSRFQNPNRTYVFPGTYTLSLSVTDEHGCTADTTLIDYLTILGPQGDLQWTSVGDACERTYNFTATNLIFVDSIVWDLGDGTILYDSIALTHTYDFGTYHATCKLIDSLGCEITYPLTPLIIEPIQLTADAGPDNEICQNNTNLQATSPLFGKGVWNLLSGNATILYPDSINSAITNLTIGTHVFEWSVFNACDTIKDTVEITYTANATIANAGPDQYICINTATLAGNEALLGTGNWSLVNGATSITNPLDSLTNLTGIGLGINELVWTISNLCSVSSDTVLIVLESAPTIPNAGADDQFCNDTYTLNGNVPVTGSGYWTLISGSATLSDSTNPSTDLTNISFGITELSWTIFNSCNSLTDIVRLERVSSGTIANAGNDQITCSSSIILSGNEAVIGAGNWNVISNTSIVTTPSDSLSEVTNLGIGTNELEWVITSFCGVTRDTVIIIIETQPDPPVVGLDTVICQDFTNLNSTPVHVGMGEWSLLSGQATITDFTNPKSGITNVGLGDHIFQWKVSNSCAADSVEVIVTRYEIPTLATAGDDITICGTDYTLTGNTPVYGDGMWNLVSGSAIFLDATNPTSTVSNLGVGENILQWTISNACGNNPDLVSITVETTPPIATTGPEQTICGGETILSGNSPQNGVGEWTITSGGGKITDPSDSTSGILELALGQNTFLWTITNSCSSSSATLTINNTGQCQDEDSLNNELLFYVPNSFTPDNFDELNKVFQPIFTSGYEPQKFTLYIFNRWGEIVFESHNADIGWKGTYGTDERLAQDGVYTWKIIFTDKLKQEEHTVVGHVVLLR